MIVIDDALAFCGGGDIGSDRWDTPEHLDDDPRRERTRRDNKCFDSRHEVIVLVDGRVAQTLASWPILACSLSISPSRDTGGLGIAGQHPGQPLDGLFAPSRDHRLVDAVFLGHPRH
jgi:phosphatidylserine/phosphatidylglycerophosphate/cardiolipin synthase-like enzyme